MKNKIVKEDGSITDNPIDATLSHVEDRINKLEKMINVLKFTGIFDDSKIEISSIAISFESHDDGLYQISKPSIKYLDTEFQIKEKIIHDAYITIKNCDVNKLEWRKVVHNDRNTATFYISDIDKSKRWYVLDKCQDVIVQIPEPKEDDNVKA